MFQFPSFASHQLCIHRRDILTLLRMGCPIRKSPGQSLLSGSPKLIAAYHVLHHLLVPRHPPYALSSLTINQKSTYLVVKEHSNYLTGGGERG
jgi:hypothetical protein